MIILQIILFLYLISRNYEHILMLLESQPSQTMDLPLYPETDILLVMKMNFISSSSLSGNFSISKRLGIIYEIRTLFPLILSYYLTIRIMERM